MIENIRFLWQGCACAAVRILTAVAFVVAAGSCVAQEDQKVKANDDQKDLYTTQVLPLLTKHCFECHGPDRQSSDYRVDSYKALLIAGDLGEDPVVPFDVGMSKLIEYVSLPESEDLAMPPEGRPRLTAAEILSLKQWVKSGAKGPAVDAVKQAEIDRLREIGLIVIPVAEESKLLYVDFQNVKEAISDENFRRLALLKDEIYELKMADAAVSPFQFGMLRDAAKLSILNVSKIESADDAVDVINSFGSLETLVLFGSDLSDAGLAKLSKPTNGSVYVGSTKVTKTQIEKFQGANSDVRVFGDVDLDTVIEIEKEDLENSAEFNPTKEKKK